ncbi:MAG: chorismate-binding protein [Crocinitomicaceae bacterium]
MPQQFYSINFPSNPLELIQILNLDIFSLHNNGKSGFILGYSNSKKNIITISTYKDYFNLKNSKKYIFGYIPYDQKINFLSNSNSMNPAIHGFNNSKFFTSNGCFILKNEICLFFGSKEELLKVKALLKEPYKMVNKSLVKKEQKIELCHSTPKKHYINTVKNIKEHIQKGDVYEINYCINFQYKVSKFSGLPVYYKLVEKTQGPFSSFLSIDDTLIMCASPERFFNKTGNLLISQPIKGTIKRGNSISEDQNLIAKLANDTKEISENIMIVDLVRNDLSKIANRASVVLKELCKIYSFQTVHQLISTIQAKVPEDIKYVKILDSMFPMGSMTGAPKIKATQIIDKYEDFKREVYSGTTGFISPNNSSDFNVVIRSIIHNKSKLTTSISVGSAITIKSIPESEYNECLLKLSAIQDALL